MSALEVELPDGTVVEFPEGTSPATMKAALAKFAAPPASRPEPSLGDRAKQAFGLTPVGIGMQLAPKVAAGIRGDAAEELPSAVGSEGYRDARWAELQRKPYLEGLKQEGRELGASVFGNDDELAQVMADAAPGSKVTQDANGNPVIELPSGERVYPNKPGLDSQDVLRTGANIASYLPAVRAARAVAGGSTALRAGATGTFSAATNAAGQKAAGREDIDKREVALTGAVGSGAEYLSPVLGKLINAMRASPQGGATRAASILKRDLGIPEPTNGQVQAFTRALDEIDAGANPAAVLGADEFGFLYTRGQRLPEGPAKRAALADEEFLRQDRGMAGDAMAGIERHNTNALQGVVERKIDQVSGGNPPATPVEAFERIGERARTMADTLQGRVSAAYDAAAEGNRAAVSTAAVQAVPDRLQRALRDFPVGDLTPATRDTLQRVRATVAGLQPGTKGVTLRAIEDQRKLISNAYGAAANETDRAALSVVKREYDRWLEEAFDNALISGDEAALAAMKEARGLRAEFGRRFEGSNADVDKFIQTVIAQDKTPDELVGLALGSSYVSKASAARFIDRLKVATDNDPQVLAALKAAHLMRLTHSAKGELLTGNAIRTNILSAERNTPSVLRSLYESGEWAQMKRLAQALEPMVPRGDLAKSSGTGERVARFLQAARSMPFLSKGMEFIDRPARAMRAYRTTRPLGRPPLPPGASAAATGSAAERGRDD